MHLHYTLTLYTHIIRLHYTLTPYTYTLTLYTGNALPALKRGPTFGGPTSPGGAGLQVPNDGFDHISFTN